MLQPSLYHFTGEVTITADITHTTNTITLHGKHLIIINAWITKHNIIEIRYDPALEFIHLITETDISIGPIIFGITYQGVINTDLKGLYRSHFKNNWVLATQFESIYARQMFPCFDEPEFKATFDMVLNVHPTLDVFSNMSIKSRIHLNKNLDEVVFETTPVMSTYTLAVVIGVYQSITSSERNFSLVVPPGDEGATPFGLEVAVRSVSKYEELLNMDYTLAKLDLIAIPESGAGAMENWGLVTFNQSALLYYKQYSTEDDKYYVASTIAHELAHQFFGNLCTMAWWNNTWLNEGIATYFEYIGVDVCIPEWKIWDTFCVNVQQSALDLDCFVSTHPLDNPIRSNNDIEEMFDLVTYNKGGAILYMVVDIIGEDNLYQGLHTYLTNCEFGTSTSQMLWEDIDHYSIPLETIMRDWTLQPGFPVISVQTYPGGIKLRQQRYLPYFEGSSDQLWWISTIIKCNNGDEIPILFNTRESEFIGINSDWYKVNYGQITFTRVNYPIDMWYKLANATLPVTDRAGILNDILTFSLDGMVPVDTALEITHRLLSHEYEYVMWASALDLLYRLDALFTEHHGARYFENYMRSLLGNINTWIWNPPVTHNQKVLQPILLSIALYFNEPHISDICTELFKRWMQTPDSLPREIQDPIFEHGIRIHIAFEMVYDRYLREDNVIQKQHYLYALTASTSKEHLQWLLNASLDPEIIKTQDRVSVVSLIASNPVGRRLAWEFVKQHWDIFNTRGQQIRNLIDACTRNFHTYDDYNNVKEFFNTHTTVAPHAVKRALERIHYNIMWRSIHIETATHWLQKFYNS